MIHNLSKFHSIFNQYITEIRDENIQSDSWRFRNNMERIGQVFAYEISKHINYSPKQVQTPLGISESFVCADTLVLGTIMRAGLPMHNGMLHVFDKAENAFISAFRKYHKDGTFTIQFEHISSPSLDDKVLILTDPMLATGASMVLAYQALLERGKPKHTHIVTAIASQEGINNVSQKLPSRDVTIWVGAIDMELTVKSYIVPGLGDAGDLAFGSKE